MSVHQFKPKQKRLPQDYLASRFETAVDVLRLIAARPQDARKLAQAAIAVLTTGSTERRERA